MAAPAAGRARAVWRGRKIRWDRDSAPRESFGGNLHPGASGMSVTAVVGCGWGDEGKGKIVDALAAERRASLVIRFNGGANAGHTVVPEVEGSSPPAWSKIVL